MNLKHLNKVFSFCHLQNLSFTCLQYLIICAGQVRLHLSKSAGAKIV